METISLNDFVNGGSGLCGMVELVGDGSKV